MINMKALVTGSAGFIGSRLMKNLQQQGHDVTGLDIKTGLDLNDTKTLLELCKEHKFEAIYHLAAEKDARKGIDESIAVFGPNVSGTSSLMYSIYMGCLDSIKQLVFASSGGAIFNSTRPVKIDDSPNPAGIYGFSKQINEYMLRDFGKDYGISTSLLRLANVYGWENKTPRNVVAKWLELAYKKQQIEVYGATSRVRDYVYIDDVVDAFIAATPGTWNVGTGKPTTLEQILQGISSALGRKIDYVMKPYNKNENDYSVLDIVKTTWWRAKTPLQDGIKKTYDDMVRELE
jgi:UDP-glucose 4-epimerase